MFSAMNFPAPFLCRHCNPHEFFWYYHHLRAHLRAAHRIRYVSPEDIVWYETYPGSSLNAPRPTPRYSRSNSRASSASSSRHSSPTPGPSHQYDGNHVHSQLPGPSHRPQNIQNTHRDSTRLSSGSSNSNSAKNVPCSKQDASTSAQSVDTGVSAEALRQAVNEAVAAQLDSEIKKRLPLLRNEINSTLENAMTHQVPELVGGILLDMANQYANPECDSDENVSSSPRTIPRTGRLRLLAILNSSDSSNSAANDISSKVSNLDSIQSDNKAINDTSLKDSSVSSITLECRAIVEEADALLRSLETAQPEIAPANDIATSTLGDEASNHKEISSDVTTGEQSSGQATNEAAVTRSNSDEQLLSIDMDEIPVETIREELGLPKDSSIIIDLTAESPNTSADQKSI